MSESANQSDGAPAQTSPPQEPPGVIRIRRKRKSMAVVIPKEESDDGLEKNWSLKELFGDERDAWLDIQQTKVKFDPKGNPTGISSIKDVAASLISMCLYDEADKRVPIDVIRKLPAESQDDLFDACQRMNGLDKRALEAKKKPD